MTTNVLPTDAELMAHLFAMDDLTLPELLTEKRFLFDTCTAFDEEVQTYLDSLDEYYEDPTIVADRIEQYHKYSGGLLGVSEALLRRSKLLEYQRLLDDEVHHKAAGNAKSKLTATERDFMARGATASMEGLVTRAQERHRTLTSRLYRQTTRKSRDT